MEEATKMLKDIIAGLSKDAASFLAKKVKDYLIDMNYKEQIDVGDAYEIYLTKVYGTYSKSKSLVYVSEERELSSFFQPIDLLIESDIAAPSLNRWDDTKKRVSTDEIAELLDLSSKILIVGSGGTGKTVLMKYFCTKAIETMNLIPIFISLRWFNHVAIGEEPFEKILYKQLRVFDFKLPYEYFLYSLEGDKYLFLLDGFDEIKQSEVSLISHQLSDFTRKYRNNHFIITSRYNDWINGLDEYKLFSICPLSCEQIKGLIEKLDIGYEFKKNFIRELERKEHLKYQSFITIPLLLSILFITYIEISTFPETLNAFYEDAFSTLLYRHDRKKEGLDRVLKSGLSYEQFKKIFVRFCFNTYFCEEYSFTENLLIKNISSAAEKCGMEVDSYQYASDLKTIACMIIKDGREYIFVHRSFQEYFAALYASEGSEDQQRELILKLLDPRGFSTSTRKNYYLPRGINGIDVDLFVLLLYSIEPKRFDHIFLWPLVKKIYSIYLANDEDFTVTAAKIFYVIVSFDPSLASYGYHISLNKEVLSLAEGYMLRRFIINTVTSKYLKEVALEWSYKQKDYGKGMIEDMIPIIQEADKDLSHFHFESQEYSLYRTHVRAIGYVKSIIEKYNELLPRSMKYSSLGEVVDNY